jgi:chromosome partition protein MukB
VSRARIAALALVNWKGVFYERYLLDRHVTALEGMNGAGKTTVMIAAYVALLPDMSKLRFTNLGETAATGGDRGIWGRLGETGRPSYTVLDLETSDGDTPTRVLAGVRLSRAAEPTVEPTAFIVTGLPTEQRLSDLLLVRQLDGDHVPELEEIKRACEAAGGAMTTYRAIKDYFAELFERGITPMRLAADEERSKLNDMLRTSMTGGISRALTSELRSFLLKEETGLADTLSRMRANLDACARTRSEVLESRRLEREITAIYEAGTEMFAAAVQGARAAASEVERAMNDARPLVDEAKRATREIETLVARFEARAGEVAQQLAVIQAEHARIVAERERGLAARAIAERLATLDAELAGLTAGEAASRANADLATANRSAARQERARAHDAYDRASHGLADLQAGIDELVRRAHGHRQFVRRLDDARRLLAKPALSPDDALDAIAELDQERGRVELDRARIERDGRDVEARRTEHATAMRALETLDRDGTGDPHTRARSVLARLAEHAAQRARRHEIERERVESVQLATRQARARSLASSLEIIDGDAVVAQLAACEQQIHDGEAAAEARRIERRERMQRASELRAQIAKLDERSARWHLASAAARRLAGAGVPSTRTELVALRDRLSQELHVLGERRTQLEAQRQELQQRAALVEQSGTNLDPELLRLRDELGGELLASRFEDLDLAAASWVEARLGPLTSALIVDDLDAAATAVCAGERLAPTVWLVKAGTVLAIDPPDELDGLDDVVSQEPFGLRVTRRLPRPSLGRRARERQVHELHQAIARDGAALDEVAARTALVAGWRRDVDALEPLIDILADGDPATAHAELTGELATLDHETATDDDAARQTAALARTRLDELRRLLPDVAFLGGPDYAARAAELAAVLGGFVEIPEEHASARATLGDLLDVLRSPPPDDSALAEHAARKALLATRLDELVAARSALEDVLVHRHASAFADAEAALDARTGLAPALEAQHAAARAAVGAAGEAEATAESAWEAATRALQTVEANRLAALAHRDRVSSELASLGPIAEGSVHLDANTLAERVVALEAEARELVAQRAVYAERLERSTRSIDDARARFETATRSAGPTVAAWTELRDSAQTDGVLHTALVGASTGRSSIQLSADAWSKRELLVDRLARARGGDELATLVRESALDGPGYLAAWQATRAWLQRRVPAQVADVDEPLLALERLRDHLDVLERRLGRQEQDLRGASEDVARGIDVQVRRAHGQVRRLSTQLEGIQFGSIHGIRVQIRRVERMEQILRALRLGEAQELLFTPTVPIEEALDEIFRRYGGGGRAGGQRLLDYREYLELAVEIRRQSSGEWETASPTKLSTGEAIGVGAALMMVVLTEWERDANLLRARRTSGSLRFLFLDEANRLSRDNLGVLFDLCKSLDLQLLIAAPEVARAEGNTTYRLVRHVTDDGREEVIVSGRRSIEPHELPAAIP